MTDEPESYILTTQPPTWWSLTPGLRWIVRGGEVGKLMDAMGVLRPSVLQQAWQSNTGEIEWRDVPTEYTE